MHAEVDEAAAAGDGAVEEPRRVRRPRLRAGMAERGAQAGDVADPPGGDGVVGGDERRREPRVLERHEHHVVSRRGGDHVVGLGGRARHRLVDEHVLAGVGGGDRDIVVQRVRCRDDDGVDVVARRPRRCQSSTTSPEPHASRAASADERERLANTVTSTPAAAQRGQVDVRRRRAAADDREPLAHDEQPRRATLRTAAATSSQSRSS